MIIPREISNASPLVLEFVQGIVASSVSASFVSSKYLNLLMPTCIQVHFSCSGKVCKHPDC
jgi:hypothetical protein